jgi:hypothetical protein
MVVSAIINKRPSLRPSRISRLFLRRLARYFSGQVVPTRPAYAAYVFSTHSPNVISWMSILLATSVIATVPPVRLGALSAVAPDDPGARDARLSAPQ